MTNLPLINNLQSTTHASNPDSYIQQITIEAAVDETVEFSEIGGVQWEKIFVLTLNISETVITICA